MDIIGFSTAPSEIGKFINLKGAVSSEKSGTLVTMTVAVNTSIWWIYSTIFYFSSRNYEVTFLDHAVGVANLSGCGKKHLLNSCDISLNMPMHRRMIHQHVCWLIVICLIYQSSILDQNKHKFFIVFLL